MCDIGRNVKDSSEKITTGKRRLALLDRATCRFMSDNQIKRFVPCNLQKTAQNDLRLEARAASFRAFYIGAKVLDTLHTC
jgi:hypothetical protein